MKNPNEPDRISLQARGPMYRNKATGEVTDDPVIVAIWREEGSSIEEVNPMTGHPSSRKSAVDSSVTVSYDPDDDQATITIVEIDPKTGLRYLPSRLSAPISKFGFDKFPDMETSSDDLDGMEPPALVRQ